MAADSDGKEDFVSFGTPLEPLEEDEPLKKPVPIYEQTVKDEKGRYQRFHGAFTGGFSAGYFNTVGSKEGWAPSTFVSSRQSKAEKNQVRPEDFMDEEDFGEHGIAPREITRSEEFSSGHKDETREKARAINAHGSLIPGDTLLEELIAPARSSIGVELLKKMGWKEGQGVGPRVKRKARRQKREGGAKFYGCALPPAGSEDSEEEDDEEFAPENVTFAPKDVTPFDFTPRLGQKGLGYHGLDPGLALQGQGSEHINLFNPQFDSRGKLFGGRQKHTRSRGVAGQAFGVGALEDEDEDIYQRDSMAKYDTVLRDEEPGDSLYGWTAPQEYTKKKDQNKDALYLGKILEGFTLAQKPEEEKMIFPPPQLPRDYRPVHRFHPGISVTHLSGVSPALAEALRTSKGHMVKDEPQTGRHQLDSGQRGAQLGEETLKGPSSVMDLLRPEDREKLRNFRTSKSLHSTKPSVSQDASRPAVPSGMSARSVVTPPSFQQQQQQEALTAWRGQSSTQSFKPFERNPDKQSRYDVYLSRLQQGDRDALEQSLDPSMTEWERSRERDEFVRASILYRPTSSNLSSRFTRGKHQDDDDTVEVNQDEEGDVDDKQAAVEMKMFGKLTRETFEWHPDKLLCKRFNVPDPYPGTGVVGLLKVKRDKFSVFNFLTVSESREPSAAPSKPPDSKKSRWDVSDQMKMNKSDPLSEMLSAARSQASDTQPDKTTASELPALPAPVSTDAQPSRTESTTKKDKESKKDSDDDDTEEEEEEEEESRPPMDLFKAIFSSSSDEKSSSEAETDDEADQKDGQDRTENMPPNLFNISSTSTVTTATAVSNQNTAPVVSPVIPVEQEEFGPKLPPPSAFIRPGPTACSLTTGEKPKKSKEKKHKNKKDHKHKKEKKKKHKKHKHKGKERKKSKKDESSSDSGEDSEGDTAEVSTDELLKRLKTIRSHQCPL